jgi:ubiquinone/menaquinone biosynthesis C-methylase UbiE
MHAPEPQPTSSLSGKKEKWTSGDAYEIWMARWSRLLAPQFLDWLEPPPGARWLDVCCGTGILSQAIATRRQPLQVVGIDRAAPLIDFARRHRSAPNIAYQAGDATALPFADRSFDVCVCGLGLNFISDPARALQELYRVTRSGGTIGAYVWEYSGQARFLREFWDAAAAVDPEAAQFDQARRFPICTQEGLHSAFAHAGLENVAVRSLDIVTHFRDFEDYWSPFLLGQGSGPTYLEQRDERIRSAIRERLRATLPVNADGSIDLGARALAARASRR